MKSEKSQCFVIGLTGGIASGKGLAAAVCKRRGAIVLHADKIARAVVAPGRPAFKKCVRVFGDAILTRGGRIHRRKLADVVFSQPHKRRKLEAIIHPEVRREIRTRLKGLQGLVVLEVPLLFESGLERWCDLSVCIALDRETQIQRLQLRDGLNRRQAIARIRAQLPLKDKLRHADVVIWNDGTRQAFTRAVGRFFNTLGATAR